MLSTKWWQINRLICKCYVRKNTVICIPKRDWNIINRRYGFNLTEYFIKYICYQILFINYPHSNNNAAIVMITFYLSTLFQFFYKIITGFFFFFSIKRSILYNDWFTLMCNAFGFIGKYPINLSFSVFYFRVGIIILGHTSRSTDG